MSIIIHLTSRIHHKALRPWLWLWPLSSDTHFSKTYCIVAVIQSISIPTGIELQDQVLTPDIPVGIPSMLLSRRPDLLQVEGAEVVGEGQG